VLFAAAAVISADAIVAVPACCKTQLMCIVYHLLHVWKAACVDHWGPILIVVSVVLRTVAAAKLPVVVEPNITVPEVTKRGWDAIDGSILAHHTVHDL